MISCHRIDLKVNDLGCGNNVGILTNRNSKKTTKINEFMGIYSLLCFNLINILFIYIRLNQYKYKTRYYTQKHKCERFLCYGKAFFYKPIRIAKKTLIR